ncbi:hypothetical protein ACJJTC_002296 [Scirpophaga incertulas]
MYGRTIILLCQLSALVLCERKYESRKARLFSFNTVNEDIRIDLDFSIPFISIPVKKTMDAAIGASGLGLPTININPASLALGGAVVLGTTVLVPLLLKSYAMNNPHHKYLRILEATEFETEDLVSVASKLVTESRTVRGCALRLACWTGQIPAEVDAMKLWNTLLNNRLLSSMINTTAVEDAMISGRHGRDCATYRPCPLTEAHMPMIISNFIMFANKLV